MLKEWHDLLVVTGGSAAALAGLVFVSVSLNLTKILSFPQLPSRAFISLLLLMSILILSIIILIPQQTIFILGLEILIFGIVIYITATVLDINIFKSTHADYKRQYFFTLLINQIALLPYIIAGIFILCCGEKGIYWVVPSIIISFIKAISDAWVLLVEINR
jgi:hypothetical protein